MAVNDWTPTVAEVGAILRARTKDTFGNELGTFDGNTRPTGPEVVALIAEAVREVTAEHGNPDATTDRDPSQMYGILKAEVIYTTAMAVELSYYPEQVAGNRSPYPALVIQRDRLSSLAAKAIMELSTGGDVGEGDDPRLPVWNFPIQGNGMVGWRSRW